MILGGIYKDPRSALFRFSQLYSRHWGHWGKSVRPFPTSNPPAHPGDPLHTTNWPPPGSSRPGPVSQSVSASIHGASHYVSVSTSGAPELCQPFEVDYELQTPWKALWKRGYLGIRDPCEGVYSLLLVKWRVGMIGSRRFLLMELDLIDKYRLLL
jgi:hypothetical protein